LLSREAVAQSRFKKPPARTRKCIPELLSASPSQPTVGSRRVKSQDVV
jgi:hypothetical protein